MILILFCGSQRKRESLIGSLSGVREDPAGILSALLWQKDTLGMRLTFMLVERI